ncbi:MAG: hypothetical protein IKK40_10420 [Bacteroidales bacterium]|nr:hypothetical protein [Bacteroidales bacterium]
MTAASDSCPVAHPIMVASFRPKGGISSKKGGVFIDNGRIWLYICVVLMYQHKGVSPEPFEQQPIKFGMFHGYGK